MRRGLLSSRRFYLVAAGFMILAAVASQVELRRDARPLGDLDRIAELRGRADMNLL